MELCQVEIWATDLHGAFESKQSRDTSLDRDLHCLQEDVREMSLLLELTRNTLKNAGLRHRCEYSCQHRLLRISLAMFFILN